jgi:hypothetical protein
LSFVNCKKSRLQSSYKSWKMIKKKSQK